MKIYDEFDSIEDALNAADAQWENLLKMGIPIHTQRYWQVHYMREFFMQELRKLAKNPGSAEAILAMLDKIQKSIEK